MTPKTAAFSGLTFSLPFILLNFVVSLRLEPFYSILGSVPAIRNSPVLPLLILLLFPVGAYVAVKPILGKDKQKAYIFNLIVAGILLIVFAILFFGFRPGFLSM